MDPLDKILARVASSRPPAQVIDLRDHRSKATVDHDLRQLTQSVGPGIIETEAKILCAIQFHAAYLETHEKMGALAAFKSRLLHEIAEITKALK